MIDRQLSEYLVENQARFYRLAYSCLHSREDALDAVQAAVCRALQNSAKLKNPNAVRSWFYRILVNECMDRLRGRRRVVFVPPDALDSGSYEDPLPEEGSLARRVDALPLEIQTIIKLRFYEELSLQEIADVAGCNLSTVKTRLYSGLRKLRVALEGETDL